MLEVQCLGLDTCRHAIVLLLVYCPVDNTLFEVSKEIRCSGVKSLLLLWQPWPQQVLSQFKKLLPY